MKKLLFLLIAAFAVLTSASAQNAYERKVFVSSDGISLNYRELTPAKIEAKKKYPLVIFMHGAGERGSDNEKLLVHGSQMFLNPANQEKYPALYNTCNKRRGLPAGPICCPGLRAIRAAKEPTPSPYYYFFYGKDYDNHYSETLEEHEQKIQEIGVG